MHFINNHIVINRYNILTLSYKNCFPKMTVANADIEKDKITECET